jgi:peptide/nickel transport system ATP-binding protein
MAILQVNDLRTWFATTSGSAKAVDGVSFDLKKGQTLAIVGESGCGKTVLATSLMKLFRRAGVFHPTGSILYNGIDLLQLSDAEMQTIRGRKMAMIFQEPMAALNPVWKIKDQIAEPMMRHLKATQESAYRRALEILEQLGVPSPDRVMETWPHTLSGGMRQRVAIAMALACKPDILIADEPTTALDVTVQAQIIDLLRDLQREFNTSIILITHDLGVVAETADDILLMYAGKEIEYGTVRDVLQKPQHPYGWGLLTSIPRLTGDPNKSLSAIPGTPPSLISVPSGCAFHPRCSYVSQVGAACSAVIPELLPISSGARHLVRCHLESSVREDIFRTQVEPNL